MALLWKCKCFYFFIAFQTETFSLFLLKRPKLTIFRNTDPNKLQSQNWKIFLPRIFYVKYFWLIFTSSFGDYSVCHSDPLKGSGTGVQAQGFHTCDSTVLPYLLAPLHAEAVQMSEFWVVLEKTVVFCPLAPCL